MRFFYLLILLFSILTISCDDNKIFEDTANFELAYWRADSIKNFEFEITNDIQDYNILLSVRNGRDYPHSNLYVQYAILDSIRNPIDEELRNFQLFHQKSGYPFGKGSGNIYEHSFGLLSNYQFPYEGKYFFSVQQYMRYDSLPEIYSVGIRIESPEG